MKSVQDCYRIYEERVIAYIDILGWKEACQNESNKLIEATQAIDDAAITYCRFTKEEMRSAPNIRISPIYENYQFGAFSDSFAVSMPAHYGYRIISGAAEVCRKLLHIGFLTRGGITVGKLHHVDNVIFGPALIDAVRLEKEAIYPRLVCSPEFIDYLDTFPKEFEPFVVDHLGRRIANLFEFCGTSNTGQPLNHREMYGIAAIENIIEDEIRKHSKKKSEKWAEKWRYMRDVLPVMLMNFATTESAGESK